MPHHSWIFRDSTIKTASTRTDTPLNLITRTGVSFFWISAFLTQKQHKQPAIRYCILLTSFLKGGKTYAANESIAMVQTDRLSPSLSTFPSTVFHVRALAKTKPQRRSGASASRCCTIIIVSWEPLEKLSALICKVLWTWDGVFE